MLSKQGPFIMATEQNVFATLACCLLAISSAMAQSNTANTTTTTPGSNTTFVTSANSTDNASVVSNVTEYTTQFTSTIPSHTQTSESNNTTPLQNTTTPMTTPGNNTPSFTAPTIQTTAGYTSTPDTTALTTAYSSNTANTSSESEEKPTQGVVLNVSEKNLTIVFSVVLGLFGFGLVVFMFNRCRHKFQYLHQPLNNTSDTDVLVEDDDTLVISGGLYDGHPNYDNAPSAPADESQFRLEFLH